MFEKSPKDSRAEVETNLDFSRDPPSRHRKHDGLNFHERNSSIKLTEINCNIAEGMKSSSRNRLDDFSSKNDADDDDIKEIRIAFEINTDRLESQPCSTNRLATLNSDEDRSVGDVSIE